MRKSEGATWEAWQQAFFEIQSDPHLTYGYKSVEEVRYQDWGEYYEYDATPKEAFLEDLSCA